jgi:hypothetical protein
MGFSTEGSRGLFPVAESGIGDESGRPDLWVNPQLCLVTGFRPNHWFRRGLGSVEGSMVQGGKQTVYPSCYAAP